MNRSQNFKFQVKEIGDKGSFVGMGAVYGNRDLGDDIIVPGAFTKTIAERGNEVPLLWQHDSREPIGMARLKDSEKGLIVEGELVLDSPVAQKAYALLKAGVLKGLSIGYDTITEKMDGGVRYLKELKLWEMSLVTFPMNERALVATVKSAEEYSALVDQVESACKRLGFNAEMTAQAVKSLRALAASPAPAAQQYDAAPDLHAMSKEIRSLAEDIRWAKEI
jgi:HK97 family phage prohead protease